MKFPSTKISNKHCKKNTSNIFYDETLIISTIKYVGRELCIDFVAQALVPFKKYMPPPLPYFKVNICPLPLPHFASIFFAYV